MSSEVAPDKKKIPWVKLAVVAMALAVAAVFVLRSANPRELLDQGMALIRGAGPWAFFTAYALLPAVGVPSLAFSLTAGSAFGESLGTGMVIFLSEVAMTANMAIAYGLARKALRPLLENLMTRMGYKLPQVDSDNVTDLVMLLRLTPGIPFFVQNYLLGLAEMPFGKYMIISMIIALPQNAAFVLFGDALVHGKGKTALIAGSLVAALLVATNLARKYYAKKKAAVV